MRIHEILEQNAVFDGKPNFTKGSLIVNVVNHESYGGTTVDVKEARDCGDMVDPRLFRVRVTIEYEEL